MIYSGQEVGEPALGNQGFSGDDGRTSIFDYCGLPEHQKWLNNGAFDSTNLSESQNNLRGFYQKLLVSVRDNEALSVGLFYELMMANEHQPGFDQLLYIYLRYTAEQRVLVIANFNRTERALAIKLPDDLLSKLNLNGKTELTDLLSGTKFNTDDIRNGVDVKIPASGGLLLAF